MVITVDALKQDIFAWPNPRPKDNEYAGLIISYLDPPEQVLYKRLR